MRISTRAFYDSVSSTVSRLQSDLGDLTVRMSDGRRIQRPSDDPLTSLVVNRTHTDLAASEARKKLLDGGLRTQRQVDSALSQISEQLSSAVDTARRSLQATAQGETTQDAAAASLRSVSEGVLNAANGRVGDRFMFAGFRDQKTPFVSTAGTVTYQGDANQVAVPLGSGRTCSVSVAGDKLLNFGGAGGVDGVTDDVFTVLERVAAAMESGDTEAVRTGVDELTALQENVVAMRGDVGSWEVRLQASRDAMDDADLISNETLEALEGLDIAEAVTDYTARESSYKAVLSVFARIMSTENLFDLTR